jgi:hypothetical protein
MASSARLSVRITAFLLVAVTSIALLEVGARVLSPDETDYTWLSKVWSRIYSPEEVDKTKPLRLPYSPEEVDKTKPLQLPYSPEEVDKTKPLQLPRQGGDCINYRLAKDRIYYKFYWNPWWGYWGKLLDSNCAKKLFESYPIKVVLLGGSAMDNFEAPNCLTRIDYLAFAGDDRIASINLAESGARLSNMVARFIHEAIELKPDVAVFLDGFNEFNSIRYGGQPGYDYYWTAGVSRRVGEPTSFLLDRLVSVSGLARILLIHTGFVRSARLPQLSGPPSLTKDVEIYLRDREVLRVLCRHYAIECVFILQPSAFVAGPADSSAARAVSLHAKKFPYDTQLYQNAYQLLRKNLCGSCVDASNLFDDVEDAYRDVVHFTKYGGAKLASLIHQQVLSAYERKVSQKNDH